MLDFAWFIVCERMIIDADSKAITIVSTFEHLKAQSLPVVVNRLDMVGTWFRSDPARKGSDALRARISYDTPSKKRVVLGEIQESISEHRGTLIASYRGFSFSEPGIYRFKLQQFKNNWTTVATSPVWIEHVPTSEKTKRRKDP